jgi:AcrR family transcriptional regulator
MGRPKVHSTREAAALLDAAEELVAAGGLAALSVRAVSHRSSTTTRAVYSLFGSKAGLIAALGARMFDLLGVGVSAIPTTERPAADLVEAGVTVFRRISISRPALYLIGVQQTAVGPDVASQFRPAARAALDVLESRFHRLRDAGQLADRPINEAAMQFHALCEGLTTVELRGAIAEADAERLWREALSALLDGLSKRAPRPPELDRARSLSSSG